MARLDEALDRCREVFPDKPILMGCYLRDYPTQAPLPMDALRRQWHTVAEALEDGHIAGFDILYGFRGTVNPDPEYEKPLPGGS